MLFSTSKRVLLSSAINCIVNSISTDPSILEAMPNNETLKVFQEEQYHQNKQQNDTLKPYLDPFTKTLLDGSAWHVTEFVLMMLHRGYFDVSEFIISVIYLTRFTKTTGITLHVSAWRPLFITALLVADKMWEDKSVKNSSLTTLFPVLSNAELFELEVRFLGWLGFSAWVARADFQRFCEGLLPTGSGFQEIDAQVQKSDYAAVLQDNISEPPSSKPTSMPRRGLGKGGGRQEVQPWNARKTLHAHSPGKRLNTSSLSAAHSPGKNGGGSDTESNASPRRKLSPQAHSSSGPPLAALAKGGGHPALQPTNSLGSMPQAHSSSVASSHSPRRTAVQPAGGVGLTTALAVAGAPPPPPYGQQCGQDRGRPNSQPAPAVQPTVPGAARLAKGRPPPTVSTAVNGQHQRAPTPVSHSQIHTASPRANSSVVAAKQAELATASAVPGGDRSSSEPAVPRGMPRPATAAAAAAAAKAGHSQCLSAQAAQHSRSTSGSAPHLQHLAGVQPPYQPQPQQQRATLGGVPVGPTTRSTVPMPGQQQTTRVARPAPVPPGRGPQVQGIGGSSTGVQVGSFVTSAGVLGRGRSSSPAGIPDSWHVPPPSARRNVAAPPPTMRAAPGIRFG